MADESAELDAMEAEVIGGGGGYVDDDIDLDDDDADDEPLTATAGRAYERNASRGVKRAVPETPVAKESDFLLRAGAKPGREYLLARFLTGKPHLDNPGYVRMYRDKEGTVNGRAAGIAADKKQQNYYNSYVGKRRLARYQNQGLSTIPDRARKGWTLEVTKSGVQPSKPPPPPLDRSGAPSYPPEADVYVGTFDGNSGSSYAVMVMNEDNRTVDVIPVGRHSWFSFRAVRRGGAANSEQAEAMMAKLQKKGDTRMNRWQAKYEDAQERIENALGGYSRFDEKRNTAVIGLRRKVNAKIEAENERGGEGLDFEEEFDNDDVAQIDKDDVEKDTDRREVRDVKRNAELLRKLIKDEPNMSRPSSPRSESDEDAPDGSGTERSKPPSRSPSPSRPGSGSRAQSPTRNRKALPNGPSRATPPIPRSTSPSNAGSRAGTPQRQEFAHLLPAPGTLPTATHVVAVLKALLRQKGVVNLKELLPFFERNTVQQKRNLTQVIKEVGQLREETPGSKNYLISLKSTASS